MNDYRYPFDAFVIRNGVEEEWGVHSRTIESARSLAQPTFENYPDIELFVIKLMDNVIETISREEAMSAESPKRSWFSRLFA